MLLIEQSGTSFLVPDFGFFVMAIVGALVSILPLLAVVAIIVVVLRQRKGAPTSGYGSPEARLEQLAQLHRNGLITQAEHDARRDAIVSSI